MEGNEILPGSEESPIADYNRNLMKDYFKKSRVTCVFVCIVVIMFVVELVMTWGWSGSGYGFKMIHPEVLYYLGCNSPVLVQTGHIYRLWTATILHAGALHLIMNTASLVLFCANVEAMFTTKIYLIVYLIGGIQGNMLFDFKNIAGGTYGAISIGASTSICAVMGLFLAHVGVMKFSGIDITKIKKNVLFMLASLVAISLLPGVDLFGHFGSLFSGIFLGLILLCKGHQPLRKLYLAGTGCLVVYTLMLCTIWVI